MLDASVARPVNEDEIQRKELVFVELFSKLFAVVVALLYLAGFLVVATHLSQYGVSRFSVFQLQYLIAGGWALGPPVLLALVSISQRIFEDRATPDIPGQFINWHRLLISLFFSGIPLTVICALLVSIPSLSEKLTWGIGIRLFLFIIAMVSTAQMFWKSWRVERKRETRLVNRHHAAPFYLIFLLMLALWYVIWFSVRIYPLVPFSLGGGNPLTVAFLGRDRKLPEGIKADPSEERSVPYELLATTDEEYVVISSANNEQSIEIRRDSVAGVVVLEGQ